MVYLISYDIAQRNKDDEQQVLDLLEGMGAIRCLYSEWLYESSKSALDIANQVEKVLSEGDRLLVVKIGPSAYTALLNQNASKALLSRVV